MQYNMRIMKKIEWKRHQIKGFDREAAAYLKW